MLPDSNCLFSQGELDSEFDGRQNRLRQAVKDIDAAELGTDDESVVNRLVERFDLSELAIRSDEMELITSGDDQLLRIPFTGSGVLLHRSVDKETPFPGRVVERSRRVDGCRVRSSWVELAVPESASTPTTADTRWEATVMAELTDRVARANARLPAFRLELRASARDAVAQRRAKLARSSAGQS